MDAITKKLDRLASLQAAADLLISDYEMVRAAAIPAEIKQRLADIDAEMKPAIEAAREGIELLTAQIEAEVIKHGATVVSAAYQAVYYKGRSSWDAKKLDGYAVAHPELLALRKTGDPYTVIKPIKGNR